MHDDSDGPLPPGANPDKRLTPAARRAAAGAADPTAETGGPAGPEPTRYGDWERKGIAVDF